MKEPFTIYHGPGYFWSIEIPHDRQWDEQWYALGREPAHYPVPALLEDSPELFHPQRLVDYDRIRMARISYSGY